MLHDWWHDHSWTKSSRRLAKPQSRRRRCYYPHLESLESRLAPAVVLQADIPLSSRNLEASGFTAALAPSTNFSNFEDISTGPAVAILTGVDDGYAPAPIGFNFTFYGVQYNTAEVSSNGFLTFQSLPTDPGYSTYGNVDLTTNTGPTRPIISPLWTDWIVSGTPASNVFYETLGTPGNLRFIVQWNQVSGYPTTPSTVTFEVVLFQSNNSIEFSYKNVVAGNGTAPNPYDFGENATIGLRSGFPNPTAANLFAPGTGPLPAGVGGLQIAYNGGPKNQPIIQNGTSYIFTPDSPPTDISLSANAFPASSPIGTTIGTLSTVDADPNDSFTYSLVNGAADNALFAISGNQLQTNALFNTSTQSQYTILVQTQDLGGLTLQKQFTLNVTSINQPPLIAPGQLFSVTMGDALGTVIGTVLASDPNVSQVPPPVLTYSIRSTLFAIDPTSGLLTVADPAGLIADIPRTFTPIVTVTDNGNPPLTDTVPITIDDIFVPIAVAILGNPATSPEGSTINLSSSVTDFPGETVTYKWSVTRKGSPVPTGTPTNAPTFSFTPTNAGSYQVTLVVADNRGNDGGTGSLDSSSTTSAAITVTNVPPVVTIGTGTPYTETGATITRSVSFTAPGANTWSATVDYGDGTTETFDLTPGNHAYDPATKTFTIQHSYASVGTFTITVTVQDSEGGSGTASVPIAVFDALEFAHIVGFAIAVAGESGTAHVDLALADGSANLAGDLTGALAGNSLALTLFNGDPVDDGATGSSGGSMPLTIPIDTGRATAGAATPIVFTDTRAETVATATVGEGYTFVVPDTLIGAKVKLYWFNTNTKLWEPVQGQGPQDNKFFITPILDSAGNPTGKALLVFHETFASQSSPLVSQLTGTVFTVCVPVGNGGTPVTTFLLPETVASNGSLSGTGISVQTTGFGGSSSLTFSLQGSQTSQVLAGLSTFSPRDAPGDDAKGDDQILNWLIEFLFRRERRQAGSEPPSQTSTDGQPPSNGGGGGGDGQDQSAAQGAGRDAQRDAVDEELDLSVLGFDGQLAWDTELGMSALSLEPSSASEIDTSILDSVFASTQNIDLLTKSESVTADRPAARDHDAGLALAVLLAGSSALPEVIAGGRDSQLFKTAGQPPKSSTDRARPPRNPRQRRASVQPPQAHDSLTFRSCAPESELMPQAALLTRPSAKFRGLMLSLAIAFLSALATTPAPAQDVQRETLQSSLGSPADSTLAGVTYNEMAPDAQTAARAKLVCSVAKPGVPRFEAVQTRDFHAILTSLNGRLVTTPKKTTDFTNNTDKKPQDAMKKGPSRIVSVISVQSVV